MTTEKLSFRERLGYGLGTAGIQLPNAIINTYLYLFFNTVVGIPALTVGTIFMIARVWDAVNDPMMGIIADRTRTRWGSYRPYILFGSIPMAVFVTLCFAGFDFSSMSVKVIFCAAAYILYGMSNTMVVIPLGSLANTLTTDYYERSVLGSFREFGSSLGSLISSLVLAGVMSIGATLLGEVHSYTFSAAILGIASMIFLFITFISTKERVEPQEVQGGLLASFKALKGNKPVIIIILFYFFANVGLSCHIAAMSYHATYCLGNALLAATMVTAFSVAPFFIMLFVPGLAKKWGKRNNMILGVCLEILCGVMLLVGGYSIIVSYAASFVWGLGNNLMFSGVWATLPDCTDYGEYKNGVKAPGLIYSAVSFCLKLTTSVGTMLLSVVLAATGFSETAEVQTQSAINGIYWFNGGAMIIFMIIAMLFLFKYDLTEEKMKEIRAELDARQNK